MLKIDGWEKVFSKTRSQGAVSSELYVDSCIRTQLNFEAKHSHVRTFETGGSHLLWHGSAGNKSVLSSSTDSGTLLSLLSQEAPFFSSSSPTRAELPWNSHRENHKILEQACRKTLLAQTGIVEFKARYEETLKQFIFATEERGVVQGIETSGCLTAYFTVGNGVKQKTFRVRKGRTDIPSLISALQETWLPHFSLDKALQQPWPAPQGKVPILWSNSCIAQFTLALLWILEYQTHKMVDNPSAIEHQLGGMCFQIIDNWKHRGNMDVEGRERVATLLIDGGKLVAPLRSTTPGFSRRANHRSYPITAPWEPALFGIERSPHLLKEMDFGVSVHEIEMLSLEPQTGQLTFKIIEASLVHQGLEGEHMESVQMSLSVFDLLRSLRLFSEQNSPEPLSWNQLGQELFVEVTAPQALSVALDLPGSVPLNHYW